MLGLLGWGRARQRPKFNAPMLSTDSVLYPQPMVTGTFTRASAQYTTDFEGITRKVESGSVAVEGSRVVTNLLTYSEDLSNAAWVATGTATKAANNVANFPSESDAVQQTTAASVAAGTTWRASFTLSGSGTTTIRVKRSADGTNESSNKAVTLSATPTRYSVSITFAENHTNVISIVNRLTGDTATSVTVHSAQLENVTAQTNQNPGEYVKTTAAAVSKCFATTNGNTVDANGVVTEATGTSLPQSYSERQNSTAYVLNDKIQVSGWWYYCTTAGTSNSSAPTFPTGKAGSQTVTDGTAVWTIGGRLLLGYSSEPASTNKVTAYGIIPADTLGSELSSGSLTIGQKYQITARTDANFIADGAADNVVGTQFVATAATVTLDAGDKVKRVQWGVGEKSFHNGSSFVQNIPGLTLAGDTAAVLSIVTDQTEIEKAGLAGINPGFKVYKLDNSAGSIVTQVDCAGTVGNTNPHSLSALMRVTAGTGDIYLNGSSAVSYALTPYGRITVNNLTPISTTRHHTIVARAASVIYFFLPQLEERSYATSIMPTSGATATRAATSLSYQTAGNLRGNDVTVGVECYLNFTPGVAYYSFATGTNLSNRLTWLNSGTTSFLARKILLGVDKYSTVTLTVTKDKHYKTLLRLSKTSGVTGFVSGTKGTTDSNTEDAALGTLLYLGASYDGLTIHPSYLRNLRIYWKALSDDRCRSLSN